MHICIYYMQSFILVSFDFGMKYDLGIPKHSTIEMMITI